MQLETFTLALLLSSLVYVSLALFVFVYFRGNPGANSFVGLMLAVSIYSSGYYFELHSDQLSQVYFWLKIEYIGITLFPVLFLLFVLQYTKQEGYLKGKVIAGLFFLPLVTYIMMYTNDSHHLFYRLISLTMIDSLDLLHIVPGPWYWVNVIYINLMVLISNVVLLRLWWRTSSPFNRQYAALFFGSVVPWIGFFVYLSGYSPLGLDLSPFGMIVTGWVYVYILVRYRIFDYLPVASTVVLDRMRDGVVVVDVDETIVDMNAAAVKFFGPRAEKIGQKLASLFYPISGIAVSIAANETGQLELEEDSPSGYHWLDLMFSPLSKNDGIIRGHAVIIRDITKRKLAQAQMEQTNNELASRINELDEFSRDMKQINDMTVQLQACNQLAEAYPIISGHMQSLLPTLAGGLYIYSAVDHTLELVCSWNNFGFMADAFNAGDCWGLVNGEVYRVGALESEISCRHVEKGHGRNYACHPLSVDGEPFALLHYYYMLINLSDNQVQMARIAADAVKMALINLKMKDSLRQESIRDPLTGLYNRRFMNEYLAMELAKAERQGKPVSAIMVDVDYYKALNDRYGHGLGDQVLIQVSQVFRENIRRADIACRYGGDEFVLIMTGVATEVALQRTEIIHQKIKQMKVKVGAGREETISLSMGVATYPVHALSVDSLLQAADRALYQAKEAGRNCTVAAE